MLKMKSTKISTLFIAAGLMILPIFLAACETATDSAQAPFGLRTEALDDLVEPETGDVAGPSSNYVADTSAGVVTAGRNGNNNQARVADRSAHVFDPETAAELTAAEAEGLIYMREEEKLARDVYLALYEQWGMPVFQNIAGSEQAHMDSVLMLLDQYELADPAAGKGAGEFTNPLFQSLYEQLAAQGGLSQADALKVGATIEELDNHLISTRMLTRSSWPALQYEEAVMVAMAAETVGVAMAATVATVATVATATADEMARAAMLSG
jgi:hypothetical protein